MSLVNESGAIVDPSEIAASNNGADDVEELLEPSLEEANETIDNCPEEFYVDVDEELEDSSVDIEPAENNFNDHIHVSLSNSMEQLRSIRQEIMASGHISRAEAVTIRNLMVSTESIQTRFESTPINSFTEMGSKVNYQSTCEGLLGSIYTTVVKIVKLIAGYIKSIGSLIYKAFTSRSGKNKQYDNVDAAVNKKAPLSQNDAGFDDKADKIVKKYSSGWTLLDSRMIYQKASNDNFGISALVDVGRAMYKLVLDYSQTLKAASPVSMVTIDRPLNISYSSGSSNSVITRQRDISKLENLVLSLNENYEVVRSESLHREANGISVETAKRLMGSPLMTYAEFEHPLEQVQAVAMIVGTTISATETAIANNVSASDEWLENRRKLATIMKDIQVACQCISDTVNVGFRSRDKLSQFKLELTR